jgi:hypothetical protein
MPIASTILMVRPASFGYNEETARNNYFQSPSANDAGSLQQQALAEFDKMVELIRERGIEVVVVDDTKEPSKPDAIFPNNWLSTSPDGIISVFPMYAANRRTEKRVDIVEQLSKNYAVRDMQDWTEYEADGRFLEGTGSMVIDHENKMIYAAISERTNMAVLEKYASANGFQAIVFIATDKKGRPVYHTNVVMTLGDRFAILCEESIAEEWELIAIRQLLVSTGHTIIPITLDQMHCFAGNMLQLQNKNGEKFLVLSQTAFESLTKEQRILLGSFSKLLPVSIPTIEEVEGGSARCMIAEIFLAPREN